MPRAPAPYTQAQLARAIRAMKQVFGSATVIFETDGRVRVTAEEGSTGTVREDSSWDDLIDLGPAIPKPTRKLTDADVKALQQAFPHRKREWILRVPEQIFHWRESTVLEQLLRYGVGPPIRLNTLRQCGPETAEKLFIRGFADLEFGKGAPAQIETLALTAAGAQAIKPSPRRRGPPSAGPPAKRRPVDL